MEVRGSEMENMEERDNEIENVEVGKYEGPEETAKKTEWILRCAMEQTQLKEKLVLTSSPQVQDLVNWYQNEEKTTSKYLGGFDISFVKGSDQGCAGLVIVDACTLQVVYEKFQPVQLDEPYVAGFLAFREVKHLVKVFQAYITAVKEGQAPQADVFLVDGNGILHPNTFGLASHLGVKLGVATIGVAKKFLHVDGLTKDVVKERFAAKLKDCEDADGHEPDGEQFCSITLAGDSGMEYGAAVRGGKGTVNPIFVSQGHHVSLQDALTIVQKCTRFRIPEPVRQADLRTRQWLRENFVNTTT